MFSGHGLEFGIRDVGPGQELVDAAIGMAVDDPGEDVGEVTERLDAVELAGLDQRGDDGPVLGAAVGAETSCTTGSVRGAAASHEARAGGAGESGGSAAGTPDGGDGGRGGSVGGGR